MDKIIELDYSLLIFLNGLNTPFADKAMMLFTAALPWIPMYLAIMGYILYRFGHKEGNYRYAIILIIGGLITFAITDMGSSALKGYFMRLRPGHDPALEGIIRLLDGKGGMYGFISSHASNVFGLATLTSLAFKKRGYSIFIFTWAFLVSYSRIYVGRHFPTDVFFGALFGIMAALIIFVMIKSKPAARFQEKPIKNVLRNRPFN